MNKTCHSFPMKLCSVVTRLGDDKNAIKMGGHQVRFHDTTLTDTPGYYALRQLLRTREVGQI